MACGPPSADMSSGIVMNGPAPIMLVMLSAVAGSSPKWRTARGASDEWSFDMSDMLQGASPHAIE